MADLDRHQHHRGRNDDNNAAAGPKSPSDTAENVHESAALHAPPPAIIIAAEAAMPEEGAVETNGHAEAAADRGAIAVSRATGDGGPAGANKL
jgi:hypothetical protein